MPDHAVVDKADHVLRQDKDIAGVGVPMKQAVYQNLLKDGVGAVRGDSLKVVAVIAQSVEVRHLDAVHIFQGQDRFSAIIRIGLRNVDRGRLEKVFPKPVDGVPFAVEVHLPFNGAAKFLHQSQGIEDCGALQVAFDQIGQALQNIDVRFDDLDYIRSSYLDDHLFTAVQSAAMDLSDGGGSQRSEGELGIQGFHRPAEFSLDCLSDGGGRHHRHLVLQTAQLSGVFYRQNVGTGGKQLAEFDKSRP